jgi:hypothetical protein
MIAHQEAKDFLCGGYQESDKEELNKGIDRQTFQKIFNAISVPVAQASVNDHVQESKNGSVPVASHEKDDDNGHEPQQEQGKEETPTVHGRQ